MLSHVQNLCPLLYHLTDASISPLTHSITNSDRHTPLDRFDEHSADRLPSPGQEKQPREEVDWILSRSPGQHFFASLRALETDAHDGQVHSGLWWCHLVGSTHRPWQKAKEHFRGIGKGVIGLSPLASAALALALALTAHSLKHRPVAQDDRPQSHGHQDRPVHEH